MCWDGGEFTHSANSVLWFSVKRQVQVQVQVQVWVQFVEGESGPPESSLLDCRRVLCHISPARSVVRALVMSRPGLAQKPRLWLPEGALAC